jgi:hypothetical protein
MFLDARVRVDVQAALAAVFEHALHRTLTAARAR